MTSEQIHTDMLTNDGRLTYKFMKSKCQNVMFFSFGQQIDMDIYHDSFIKFKTSVDKGLGNYTNLIAYFIKTYVSIFNTLYVRNRRVQYTNDLPELAVEGFEHSTGFIGVSMSVLIEVLKPRTQMLLTLKYIEDKNDIEIAEEMDISYENVRKYHYKAIKRLQKTLSNNHRELIID